MSTTHLCLGVHPCKECADKPRNLVISLPSDWTPEGSIELLIRTDNDGNVTVDARAYHGVWTPSDFIEDLTWDLRA